MATNENYIMAKGQFYHDSTSDPKVLKIGDGVNELKDLPNVITSLGSANLKVDITLEDGLESNDLPQVDSPTPIETILNVTRNCLKWLVSKFNPSGVLTIDNGGTGRTDGKVTSLATARTIRTSLASTSAASFDGSANITPGVNGTLPVGNGGTGRTTGAAPIPQTSSGVGQWSGISLGINTAYSLPSGGTWAYFLLEQVTNAQTSTETRWNIAESHTGVASGATQIRPAQATRHYRGFAWRIS